MGKSNYKNNLKSLLLILSVGMFGVFSSCTTLKLTTAENVESGLNDISAKYVVVYSKTDSVAWRLSKSVVFENKNTLYGRYENLGNIGDMDKTNVVHMYITDFTLIDDGQVQIPFSSIFRVEYYKGSYGNTTGAAIAGGVIVGATLVVLYLFFNALGEIGEDILLGIFGG